MKTLLMTFLTVSTVFAWSWVVVQIIDWRSNKKWLADREKRDREIARDNHYDAARETLQRVRGLEADLAKLTTIVTKQNKGKKS
jgi:hypothetical protein